MLRRTQANCYRGPIKMCGGAPTFAVQLPFYMKHAPGNPWFLAKHDGVTEEYNGGYTVNKGSPLNHLYRFKFNTTPFGSGPFYLRNPGGKCPHWLAISMWGKFKVHAFGSEASMHAKLAAVVVAIVIWNLSRYLFFHPDLTVYNVAYFTIRKYLNVLRNNEPMNLDSPVFRWAQQAPEFYNYHPQREFVSLGILANDPQVEYMKAIGKEELLTKYYGEPGYNTAVDYLPKHKYGYSYKEKAPENPIPTKGAAAAHH